MSLPGVQPGTEAFGEGRSSALPGVLRRTAATWPDRVAYRCGDLSRTWAEVDARVDRLAAALQARGVAPGDRVAVLSGGTITHIGTHAELLAEVPEYRELLSADAEEVAA